MTPPTGRAGAAPPGRARSGHLAAGALALLAALAAASCGKSAEAPAPPTGAILLTLDTTIPEALSCYPHGKPGNTPVLDALAAQGVLYEDARTVAPMTLPAHTSILTGLYPPRHSVRMNGAMVLPPAAETLAERAKARGWQTGAFVAAVVLGKGFGLEQGFDVYDQPASQVADDSRLESARSADQVIDAAIGWLREKRDPARPFLLWVHLFDPHAPYDPPPAYAAKDANPVAKYFGEVAYMDSQIGRLFDELRAENLWDRTLVAVAADHGEGLGRHGQATHAAFVFDTTIHVPMILRFPDGRRAGEREKGVVSVVDLFPTLVDALDLGPPGDVDGIDLMLGPPPADRGVYFESYYGYLSFGWSPITGWADARAKYMHSSKPELYDLVRDPGEEHDLLPGENGRVGPYREGIARIARRPELPVQGLEDRTGKIRAQLEALGYAGGAGLDGPLPGPLDEVPFPSPHQRIEPYARYLRTIDLLHENKNEEALPILQQIVKENPRNHSAAFLLGLCLSSLHRWEEAIAAFDLSMKHREGEWMGGLVNKAAALQNLGRGPEAVPLYEKAFAMGDGPPGALEQFVQLLRRLGDTQKLAVYEERLRKARAGRPDPSGAESADDAVGAGAGG